MWRSEYCCLVGWIAREEAHGRLSSKNTQIWSVRFTRCCTTREGWYTDLFAKSNLNYGSDSLCMYYKFVLVVLVEQLYVHTKHSKGERIVRHTPRSL